MKLNWTDWNRIVKTTEQHCTQPGAGSTSLSLSFSWSCSPFLSLSVWFHLFLFSFGCTRVSRYYCRCCILKFAIFYDAGAMLRCLRRTSNCSRSDSLAGFTPFAVAPMSIFYGHFLSPSLSPSLCDSFAFWVIGCARIYLLIRMYFSNACICQSTRRCHFKNE